MDNVANRMLELDALIFVIESYLAIAAYNSGLELKKEKHLNKIKEFLQHRQWEL